MGDYDIIVKIADIMKNVEDGFLTEIGNKLIQNDLFSDLEMLREGVSQKPLCRVCCFMCVVYNLCVLFMAYVSTLENASDDMKNLSVEAKRIGLLFESELPNYLKHLTDKYAQRFHDVKVQSFIKPIFGSVHHIPAHPDDIPEGFDSAKLYKNG